MDSVLQDLNYTFRPLLNIVNKTVKVNGLDYTVLGVTSKALSVPNFYIVPEFWAPMSTGAARACNRSCLRVARRIEKISCWVRKDCSCQC